MDKVEKIIGDNVNKEYLLTLSPSVALEIASKWRDKEMSDNDKIRIKYYNQSCIDMMDVSLDDEKKKSAIDMFAKSSSMSSDDFAEYIKLIEDYQKVVSSKIIQDVTDVLSNKDLKPIIFDLYSKIGKIKELNEMTPEMTPENFHENFDENLKDMCESAIECVTQ